MSQALEEQRLTGSITLANKLQGISDYQSMIVARVRGDSAGKKRGTTVSGVPPPGRDSSGTKLQSEISVNKELHA